MLLVDIEVPFVYRNYLQSMPLTPNQAYTYTTKQYNPLPIQAEDDLQTNNNELF
jgi:hypothetical protein